MAGTRYSREDIVRYLETARLSYQRIELPYGLATPGPDRRRTADVVFPAELGGQSVLDVGCFLGYFCHEAKRRGAGEVVGLDSNPERLGHARRLADMAGHDIAFRACDVETDELPGRFDIVVALNLLHHLRW